MIIHPDKTQMLDVNSTGNAYRRQSLRVYMSAEDWQQRDVHLADAHKILELKIDKNQNRAWHEADVVSRVNTRECAMRAKCT